MSRKVFAATALTVLVVLTVISLTSSGGKHSLPPKLVVLFGLLFIAAVAFRMRIFWLRYPLLIASIAYLGFFEGSCLCPNGALQNIPLFLARSRVAAVGIYLLEVTVILAVVYFMGNLFCGWVCHKGGVQEFLYRPRWAVRIPPKVDAFLHRARYVLLAIVVAYPLFTQKKFFSLIDPFKALFNLRGAPLLLAFLGLTLIASVFIYRPFCRYLCPFGALAGAFAGHGFFELKASETCSSCRLCAKSCSAGALSVRYIFGSLPAVAFDGEACFTCMECVRTCPRRALTAGHGAPAGAYPLKRPDLRPRQPLVVRPEAASATSLPVDRGD